MHEIKRVINESASDREDGQLAYRGARCSAYGGNNIGPR